MDWADAPNSESSGHWSHIPVVVSLVQACNINGNLTGSSAGLSLSYNALNQTASITPPGGSAIGMSYAGDSQVERVAAGSRSFTNSALGLSLAADGSGTTAYIRDNQGKLTEQRTPGGNYYYLFDGLGSVVALTDSIRPATRGGKPTALKEPSQLNLAGDETYMPSCSRASSF